MILTGANHDQTMGIQIAMRAMEDPLRQICENAGEESSVILNQLPATVVTTVTTPLPVNTVT